MAETICINPGKTPCIDCGEFGEVMFEHHGPLVPPGKIGYFCGWCINARTEYLYEHGVPKPFPEAPAPSAA